MPNIIEITNFSDPRLDLYARLSETQLAHCYEPSPGLFLAESPRVIERALDAGYEPLSLLVERRHIDGQAKDIIDRCEDIPVFTADFAILSKLTGYPLTRGALCAMRRRSLPSPETVCADACRIVVLENVMNPTNVGAIFRSASSGFPGHFLMSRPPDVRHGEWNLCTVWASGPQPWHFAAIPSVSRIPALARRKSWPSFWVRRATGSVPKPSPPATTRCGSPWQRAWTP